MGLRAASEVIAACTFGEKIVRVVLAHSSLVVTVACKAEDLKIRGSKWPRRFGGNINNVAAMTKLKKVSSTFLCWWRDTNDENVLRLVEKELCRCVQGKQSC